MHVSRHVISCGKHNNSSLIPLHPGRIWYFYHSVKQESNTHLILIESTGQCSTRQNTNVSKMQ